MTIIARKVIVSKDARLTRDIYCNELKIIGDDGKERDMTPREMVQMSNGFNIIALGRSDT